MNDIVVVMVMVVVVVAVAVVVVVMVVMVVIFSPEFVSHSAERACCPPASFSKREQWTMQTAGLFGPCLVYDWGTVGRCR